MTERYRVTAQGYLNSVGTAPRVGEFDLYVEMHAIPIAVRYPDCSFDGEFWHNIGGNLVPIVEGVNGVKRLLGWRQCPIVDLPMPNIERVRGAVMQINDEERKEVFANFCVHCGCDDPRCQCWNAA